MEYGDWLMWNTLHLFNFLNNFFSLFWSSTVGAANLFHSVEKSSQNILLNWSKYWDVYVHFGVNDPIKHTWVVSISF